MTQIPPPQITALAQKYFPSSWVDKFSHDVWCKFSLKVKVNLLPNSAAMNNVIPFSAHKRYCTNSLSFWEITEYQGKNQVWKSVKHVTFSNVLELNGVVTLNLSLSCSTYLRNSVGMVVQGGSYLMHDMITRLNKLISHIFTAKSVVSRCAKCKLWRIWVFSWIFSSQRGHKLNFSSVTDFSLGNLPGGNFIVWSLDMSREQQSFPWQLPQSESKGKFHIPS